MAPSILIATAVTHGHRTYASTLIDAFTELGVAVDHLAMPRNRPTRAVGFKIKRLRGRDLQAVRRQVALDLQWRNRARSAMRDYDLVHVMPHGFAHAFALAKEQGQARFSVALDGTGELLRDDFGASPLQERLRSRFERTTFAAADHVVCLSEWARRSVIGYGVPAERTVVVPPSTPIIAGGGDRATADATAGRLRIAFVGSPWRRKGGDRAVAWHREHWRDRADLHVVCRDAPSDLGERAGVVVHDAMPRQQLIGEFLPSCDLLVFPTRRDQSPWILAEAAGAGLPVVAYGVGGIGELVLDGVTGTLVPPGDEPGFVGAVDRLLGDVDLRRQQGAAAIDHARARLFAPATFGALAAQLLDLAARAPA